MTTPEPPAIVKAMAPDPLAGLLTTAQVAEAIGIDRSQVLRIARQRKLGQRVGQRVLLFGPADLAVLRARKTRPGPVPALR